MTLQILDTCRYKNEFYLIPLSFNDRLVLQELQKINDIKEPPVGLYPEKVGLINPFHTFGFTRGKRGSTACWRGYVLHYLIQGDRLYLDGLDINAKNPMSLNNVSPQENPQDPSFWMYSELHIPLDCTGGFLLVHFPSWTPDHPFGRLFQTLSPSTKRIGIRFIDGRCVVGFEFQPNKQRISFSEIFSKDREKGALEILKMMFN